MLESATIKGLKKVISITLSIDEDYIEVSKGEENSYEINIADYYDGIDPSDLVELTQRLEVGQIYWGCNDEGESYFSFSVFNV